MEWRTVPDWPKYKVSSTGSIIGQRNKMLKPASSDGYKAVSLCNNKYRKTIRVHRIVAMAFLPNPDNKPTVNHKNGNKQDNRVENLEWFTVKEQQIHRSRVLGFGNQAASKALCKPVQCVETGEIFNSLKEAAKSKRGDRYRLSQAARSGRTWHGLHWVFISERRPNGVKL